MDRFAIRSEAERRDIFQEAAARRNLLPIIFEKDFWVCWTLKKLCESPALAPYLTFKGGTSLSKAYGLIERFSEDIDLTISRQAPYVSDGKNPMEEGLSGKERGRRIETLTENAQRFVSAVVLPSLETHLRHTLEMRDDWELALDKEDPTQQTILFFYPRTVSYNVASLPLSGYIKSSVRLEFGARGEIEPHESKVISPYVADMFPQLFTGSQIEVPTLSVERTFWEKVTLLHSLYHGSKIRDRMSRHYYDTYMMMQKEGMDAALGNDALLEQVVRNKSLLFKDPKASYETAQIGSLRLAPPVELLPNLRKDYEAMQEMFMDVPPDFDDIMAGLATLERCFNKT